jgi:hypothetical protein
MMRREILALGSMILLTGCPRQALFVVLPNAGDGGVGAITVEEGETATTLEQPYAAAESRAGSTARIEESRENINVIFRHAIAAQPILPHHFRLYFILGSDELTPESKIAYRAVFDDVKQRLVYEIEVIGFADTLGDPAYNHSCRLPIKPPSPEIAVSRSPSGSRMGHPAHGQQRHVVRLLGASDKAADVIDDRCDDTSGIERLHCR